MVTAALNHIGKYQAKELFRHAKAPHFFFKTLLNKLFRGDTWPMLDVAMSLTRTLYWLVYAIAGMLVEPWTLLVALGLGGEYIARLSGALFSRSLLSLGAPIASIYLTLFLPISALPLWFAQTLLGKKKSTSHSGLTEMIRESSLAPQEEMLVRSFVHFQTRVVKEIMVPRVDLFCLSLATTIREATRLLAQEGYSRVPVYQETLDQIVGVVLYKDLLKSYALPGVDLDKSVETLVKPVLYAPENKKIAHLLQEFRTKQIHMAIVVDEYGGTEGIVTIEDILEELVGEIEDEYDIGADKTVWDLPGGGWVVDAKMTIIAIKEQLDIAIPESPEYETIGGYIYHAAGTIPPKGWRMFHDDFELEVLSSNERAIKKVKIVPPAL
jgi:CBS domain containing-hemolysin-like protein